MFKFFWMSCWTLGVAVAVKAMMGTSAMPLMMGLMRRYSGRKS